MIAPTVISRRTTVPVDSELARWEVEPALEQDQRHRQIDTIGNRVPPRKHVGVDHPEHRTEEQPGDQQQDDRRDLGPPREPLRGHADADDDGQSGAEGGFGGSEQHGGQMMRRRRAQHTAELAVA